MLDETLVRQALKHSRSRTKKGLVEEALRSFIRQKETEQRVATYRDRVRTLEIRLGNTSLSESPRSVLRADRNRT